MYLDNAATTPLHPQVKEHIISLLDTYQNPSSVYQSGVNVKQIINIARNNVANFINADPNNIIFTSGGSASNTLAIRGFRRLHRCILYYSPLLHKSAQLYIDTMCCNIERLKVDNQGNINIEDFEKRINPLKYKPFVVIEYANSEIGTIQNVKKIIEITHKARGVVYLDCTGSISSIPVDVKDLDVDMLGFSAHKLGALKGCGILYKKNNINIEPLIYGSQEKGLFGGTENVIGISALGEAVKHIDYSSISFKNRDYVYDYIIKNIPDSYLVGGNLDNRLPYNLYVCFKGVSGEALMLLMDMQDIQISTGSACSAGSQTPSNTLLSIGINKQDMYSCVRLSFSGNETKKELDSLCEKLNKNVKWLRQLSK